MGGQDPVLKFLLYMFIGVLLLIASIGMLSTVQANPLKAQIAGETPEDLTLTDKQDPYSLLWVSHVPTFESKGSVYQLSEVACDIAGKINTDFITNGFASRVSNIGTSSTEASKNCLNNLCVINNGVGLFALENSPTAPSQQARDAFSAQSCGICEEPQGSGGVPITNLDEVCISYNLKAKNSNMCAGDYVTSGGSPHQFGDNNCANIPNPKSWQDRCKDFCGSYDNDGIYWSGSTVLLTQDVSRGIATPHNSEQIRKYPYEYIYGILWDSGNKRYQIEFDQVPTISHLTDDTAGLGVLGNVYKDFVMPYGTMNKKNTLGTWYGEAREIRHIVFTPSSNTPVSTILNGFMQNYGNVIRLDHTCTGKDCLYSASSKPVKDGCTGFDGSEPIAIKIDSNIGDNFIGGQSYEIVDRNWGAALSCQYIDRTLSIAKVNAYNLKVTSGTGSFCVIRSSDNSQECTTDSMYVTFDDNEKVKLKAYPGTGVNCNMQGVDSSGNIVGTVGSCLTDEFTVKGSGEIDVTFS